MRLFTADIHVDMPEDNHDPSFTTCGSQAAKLGGDFRAREVAKQLLIGSHPAFMNMKEIWDKFILDEPPLNAFGTRIRSVGYELLNLAIIVGNLFVVAASTDAELGQAMTGEGGLTFYGTWWWAEMAFLSFFTLDVILKFVAFRLYFFVGTGAFWNNFDFAVVAASWSNVFLRLSGANLTFLRIIKVLRVFRILQALHFLDELRELRLILEAVMFTLNPLVLCLAIIVFFVFLGALYFVQETARFIVQDAADVDQAALLIEYFGGILPAMRTLIMVVSGGFDWVVVEQILAQTGTNARLMLIFFVLFFHVAIWNVVTATFVEKAFRQEDPDPLASALESFAHDDEEKQRLVTIIEELLGDGEDEIDSGQMLRLVKEYRFQVWLLSRRVDLMKADTLFRLMAVSMDKNNVKIPTFVDIVFRIAQPQASALDIAIVRHEMLLCYQAVERAEEIVEHSIERKMHYRRRRPRRDVTTGTA
jgi:hypothetical protein